jgi:hypothetical protein
MNKVWVELSVFGQLTNFSTDDQSKNITKMKMFIAAFLMVSCVWLAGECMYHISLSSLDVHFNKD